MSVFKHIFILIALVILLAAAYMLTTPSSTVPTDTNNPNTPANPNGNGAVFCTMDALMCADGSYVGRTGPNCQFVCPAISSSTSQTIDQKMTIGLNEPRTIGDTTITATRVVEDSRCPRDVMCIQAGRVRVALNIVSPSGTLSKEVEIGNTIMTDTLSITLENANPYPISTQKIADREYRFTLDVKGK